MITSLLMKPWKHGHGGYTNHDCRCDICKTAVMAYNRRTKVGYQAEYRKRKRKEKLAYGREYKRRNWQEIRAKERAKKRTPEGLRKARRNNENRRARKLNQFLEDVDPRVVYQMHGGCCGICEQFVAKDEFHVDHVIPLSKGGLHGYINCQLAHPRCNLSKGASLA